MSGVYLSKFSLEERIARIRAMSPAEARAKLASALAEDEELRKAPAGTIERLREDLDLGPQDALPRRIDRRPGSSSGGRVLIVRQKT